MTYVADQTSIELRAHMKRITAMDGWHEPLAARLWWEIQSQDAEIGRQRAALSEARTILNAAAGLPLPSNVEIDFGGAIGTIDAALRQSVIIKAQLQEDDMQPDTSHGINWFVGSNGNLFGDVGEYRYCIAREEKGSYWVARNGVEIAKAPSVAEAKLFIKRDAA